MFQKQVEENHLRREKNNAILMAMNARNGTLRPLPRTKEDLEKILDEERIVLGVSNTNFMADANNQH